MDSEPRPLPAPSLPERGWKSMGTLRPLRTTTRPRPLTRRPPVSCLLAQCCNGEDGAWLRSPREKGHGNAEESYRVALSNGRDVPVPLSKAPWRPTGALPSPNRPPPNPAQKRRKRRARRRDGSRRAAPRRNSNRGTQTQTQTYTDTVMHLERRGPRQTDVGMHASASEPSNLDRLGSRPQRSNDLHTCGPSSLLACAKPRGSLSSVVVRRRPDSRIRPPAPSEDRRRTAVRPWLLATGTPGRSSPSLGRVLEPEARGSKVEGRSAKCDGSWRRRRRSQGRRRRKEKRHA
ncbi:hypothetical protein C8Q78DRAFT_585474 [Trametes maxima]|nr:hypothetical protein C8Q78DRAFT_585474 [Trametes maxima]